MPYWLVLPLAVDISWINWLWRSDPTNRLFVLVLAVKTTTTTTTQLEPATRAPSEKIPAEFRKIIARNFL